MSRLRCSRFPTVRLVGRTQHLREDLPELLGLLGYVNHTLHGGGDAAASSKQCDFACGTEKMQQPQLQQPQADWFDDYDACLVRLWYPDDFDIFGFSTDPRRMWEEHDWPHTRLALRRPEGRSHVGVQCAAVLGAARDTRHKGL